jgi:hypothetical protein
MLFIARSAYEPICSGSKIFKINPDRNFSLKNFRKASRQQNNLHALVLLGSTPPDNSKRSPRPLQNLQ